MRRVALIFLSLVLALVGGSAARAEDGFYVIPAMKGNYAPVPKTGQTQFYATGDDGYWHKGVAWPNPRFTDNHNGTVTDNLTGLIWMQNASYFGPKNWADAVSAANALAAGPGENDLKDGSKAGDWRLPNIRELQSLVDYGREGAVSGPAVPVPNPFTGVESSIYWSSTTYTINTTYACYVYFYDGRVDGTPKSGNYLVWCVRGGQ
jgi:hypothetical protein